MTHDDAIDSHAAAAYILGDLKPEDRLAFEEHYADCGECFQDVKAGATLRVMKSVKGGKRSWIERIVYG